MAEESEKSAGLENPAQILALAGASRDKADAYLALQMEEMRQRAPFEMSHLRLRRFSGWAKAAFEFSAGLLALALVGGLSAMVWNAAHSEGLIVDSFAVPPELASQGLSGQVVAGQLIDRLTEFHAGTYTARAPKSFSNNWGDDIMVEIPETGVSIGEAYRFLKTWLGHETHVSGEVWKSGAGLSIATRVSNGGGSSRFSGADLDALVQQTAEDIYRRTQPYRYANYLSRHGRGEEAITLFKTLAASGAPVDRGWALIGWSNLLVDTDTIDNRRRMLQAAAQYGVTLAYVNLANMEGLLGHTEQAVAMARAGRRLMQSDASVDPAQSAGNLRQFDGVIAGALGDYQESAQVVAETIAANLRGGTGNPTMGLARARIRIHDLAGARDALANPVPFLSSNATTDQLNELEVTASMAIALNDWPAAYDAQQKATRATQPLPGRVVLRRTNSSGDPRTALVAARLGKFSEAEALVRPMPADCYQCLIARGQVAALEGRNGRADFWFARAVASNPAIPLAEQEWGQALLGRRHYDRAIAKFAAAVKKGPHFADAMEGWGEALMAKNQSHLALAKFAEAEKYAPNWGRLQLKWAEALVYAGKKDEARAHFARAATLDLTPSENAELAKASGHV